MFSVFASVRTQAAAVKRGGHTRIHIQVHTILDLAWLLVVPSRHLLRRR